MMACPVPTRPIPERIVVVGCADTAYPIVLNIPPTCAANPKVTAVTDNLTGQPVLVITLFIYGECVQPGSNQSGEMEYVISAQ